MDDRLRLRLDVFRDMAQTPPGVVEFVASELALLEPDFEVTDDTAGSLTSHLVAALGRMVRREPDIDPPADAVYQQVVDQFPAAVDAAADVSERARAALGVPLSAVERQYLSLHLGALALTASKENR
ncbi:transcriptional antiterminator [Jiangella rhizosphaerae]|uniref:Transcriptional antiterminator n=1 Tax=Jiangella rhizosphaerae TaxID=2293569 RepID=A0A418KRA6_9ACTN|nr:transcriptional antiterminator [Jiangella rhizosphaerae]RIQ23118.1 transcriptional antiterminator [Jiangella rhizosphaerae]